MNKDTHQALKSLIMSYGSTAYYFHSHFDQAITDETWEASLAHKRTAMENALKDCMMYIEEFYKRK